MRSSQRVHFTGGSGARLVARLELPEVQPAAWAIFAHCFTCSKDLKAAVAIGRALAERGIAVLRFDFTGIGESEGRFEQTSFASNVEDMVAAAAWLRENHEAPRLLVGHSLGGAAAVVAAPHIPEVRAVATLAAPFDPSQTRARLERHSPELATRGEAEVELGGRRFVVRRSFWDQTGPEQMSKALAAFQGALLVLHSPEDKVVAIEEARRLFEAARHPKSFVSLDDADHLLMSEADSGYAASVLASWASRYISAARGGEDTDRHPAGEAVVVREVGASYEQEIEMRQHRIRADEPVGLGGGDRGPTPYELLLAALGSCTSMTLRMYANVKKWPLERVSVRLRHKKIHARDCAGCESGQGRIERIDRVIELVGPLDEEQRQRLLQIAERCPVHRTLEGDKNIVSLLADKEPPSGLR